MKSQDHLSTQRQVSLTSFSAYADAFRLPNSTAYGFYSTSYLNSYDKSPIIVYNAVIGGDVLKIRLEHAEHSELEVVIKGDLGSEEAIRVISALNTSAFGKLMLQGEDESFLFDAADILYFVSEQGKTCAVTENGKFEVREKLYALSGSLKSKGFIQINKSTVVNINFVKSISAEFSGNYTARLKGRQETLIISRKYFHAFKEFVRR